MLYKLFILIIVNLFLAPTQAQDSWKSKAGCEMIFGDMIRKLTHGLKLTPCQP